MTEEKEFVGVNLELFTNLTHQDIGNPEWFVEVDGRLILYKEGARFFNPKRGLEWRLGRKTDGYVGVIGHEPGGGGSVSFPFVIWRHQLWIGMVEESRNNMGGKVLCAPGGFLDPGETHFKAAQREFEEEVEVETNIAGYIDLNKKTEPTNANRAFFDTSRTGEGNHYYAWEFTEAQVSYNHDVESNMPYLTFKKDLIKPQAGDKSAERIFGCRFYPWHIIAGKSDIFCNAMFSRLFLYLVSTGRAKVTFP